MALFTSFKYLDACFVAFLFSFFFAASNKGVLEDKAEGISQMDG